MVLRYPAVALCLAFGPSLPASAASFVLSDLRLGSGVIEYTEVRGPQAYVADGALEFSLDWAAIGPSPVRLDLDMRWRNNVGPHNEGYLNGDDLSFGGYFSHGFVSSPFELSLPDYQQWSENSVAFGYANITPDQNDFALVWDFFGWGDTVDWRLEYALAPVPLPAAGLLLASALGLAALRRRKPRA